MARSMLISEVLCGGYAYADQVACYASDPLAILMAEEEGEEMTGIPSTDFVMTQCELHRVRR
jgi:hypothetical protein